MIRELQLQNFRGFPQYKLASLGRVNLLVGTNNSGKTSLLEAVELLLAHGDPRTIWISLSRRGERVFGDDERGVSSEFDISHLFYGHTPDFGSSFSIVSQNDVSSQRLTGSILEVRADETGQERMPVIDGQLTFELPAGLHLEWISSTQSEATHIPLTGRFGVSMDAIRRRMQRPQENRTPVAFVTTESLSEDEVIAALSGVVLDPEEDFVLQAMRIIDPSIERIAPVIDARATPNFPTRYSQRGGVVVKSRDIKGRIPIGTMGDGIWHLLSLALSLVRARGGVLLVDEIDTGLHYSVMEDMWRLVQKTAQRLDVQVFATTHSSDCWKALASVCSREKTVGSEVSIQRIEPHKAEAIVLPENEIVIAAEQGMEVR